jgi:tRNA A-37 threonylcarbamoyl transferase component Bud32
MTLEVRYLNSEVKSSDLAKLCGNPDHAFPDGEIVLKDDATTTVRRLKIDLGDIVVKRYNTKNFWHMIRRNFQKSRAENCHRMAGEFRQKGIVVPETLAVIKNCVGPFSGPSWYVSRHQESELLLDYLDHENWRERLNQVASQVMELFTVMVRNSLSHGDMKATNLLVDNGDLVVIDLDAARRHRIHYLHRIALHKDRIRFLKNWSNRPELAAEFERRLTAAGVH